MVFLNNTLLIVGSTVVAIFMGITMNVLRLRTAKKPTNTKRIILPPIFMSSGLLMFLFPTFHITWLQVLEAFSVGAFMSILLIWTTSFQVKGRHIYLKPSKAFIFILFGLLFLRLMIKLIIGSQIDVGETSGMFFVLAFGMILTWRISMLVEFKKIKKTIQLRREHV